MRDPDWQGGNYAPDKPPRNRHAAGAQARHHHLSLGRRMAPALRPRAASPATRCAPSSVRAALRRRGLSRGAGRALHRASSTRTATCTCRAPWTASISPSTAAPIAARWQRRARLEQALVIGVESDLLFPIHEQAAIAEAFEQAGVRHALRAPALARRPRRLPGRHPALRRRDPRLPRLDQTGLDRIGEVDAGESRSRAGSRGCAFRHPARAPWPRRARAAPRAGGAGRWRCARAPAAPCRSSPAARARAAAAAAPAPACSTRLWVASPTQRKNSAAWRRAACRCRRAVRRRPRRRPRCAAGPPPCACAPRPAAIGGSRIGQRLPDVAHRHIVQRQRAAHAVGDRVARPAG